MGCGSSSAQHATLTSPVADPVAEDDTGVPSHRRERTRTVLQETERGTTLSQMDQHACVLVSDMKGFTSQTRAHGIIHFGSKILRMRQVLHPILLRHAPLVVSTEADNFLVVFETVEAGLRCAVDMMQCCHAYNSRLHGAARKNRLELGGIGLDWGSVTLEAPSGTLYGVAADGAFLLGEDVSDGEILLTHRVRDELARAHSALLESFVHLTRKDDADLEFEHLQGHYFIATPRKAHRRPEHEHYALLDAEHQKREAEQEKKEEAVRAQQLYSWTWEDCSDASYIGEDCTLLTRRHRLGMEEHELAALDAEISARFLGERDVAVVMFGLHTGKVTERLGITSAFTIKHRVLELLDPVIAQYGGRSVEDTFLVFEHEHEAVACALALSARIALYNSTEAGPDEQIQPKGFGVHAGPMLIVPGTNVHWGDCVSTASKLGEDLGLPGEVLASDRVWKACQGLPCFAPPTTIPAPTAAAAAAAPAAAPMDAGAAQGEEAGAWAAVTADAAAAATTAIAASRGVTAVAKQLETSGVQFVAYSLSGTIDPDVGLPPGPHSYASANIAAEAEAAAASRAGTAPGTPAPTTPARRPKQAGGDDGANGSGAPPGIDMGSPSAKGSPSLSSFNGRRLGAAGSPSGARAQAPLVRTITAGAHLHSTVRVLDYARTGRRNSDLGSMFVEPAVGDSGPVNVMTGVMSPNLAGKLLQHSPSVRPVQPPVDSADRDGRARLPHGLSLDAPPADFPHAHAHTHTHTHAHAHPVSPAARQMAMHGSNSKPNSRRSTQEREAGAQPAMGSIREHRHSSQSKRRSSSTRSAEHATTVSAVSALLHAEPAPAVSAVASPVMIPSAVDASSGSAAAAAAPVTPVDPSTDSASPLPSPPLAALPAKLAPLSSATARGGSLQPLKPLAGASPLPLSKQLSLQQQSSLGARTPLPPLSTATASSSPAPSPTNGANGVEATTPNCTPLSPIETDAAAAAPIAAAAAAAAASPITAAN